MKRHKRKIVRLATAAIIIILILTASLFSLPKILAWTISHQTPQSNTAPTENTFQNFPVTVDPKNKIITENDQVNAFLADKHSLLGAAVSDSVGYIWNIFKDIAITITDADWYQNTASVSIKFINITPGMRKEQVADAFGNALKWNLKQKKELISTTSPQNGQALGSSTLPFSEGSFFPGLYEVSIGMNPKEIQTMINNRFSDEILLHYSTSTQEIVPLDQALTIASLIQRETLSTDGMRLLSGIIWNRLFAGMDLQIDSTLQYAKANKPTVTTWWPKVTPKDKYIKSPYNTYIHNGLPPTPIANPGVEAILAALNPIKTTCLFYFNDPTGTFHCSDTYTEHVSLIKKYYGN